tara:strand:+ start:258 stop:545 length:288 start_codon:yes stop_codon:yes gene_type:complete
MSGDNLHGEQPDIRYSVNVHTDEEWKSMSLSERLEIMSPAIEKWESEYLTMQKSKLSKQQIDILSGRDLKSHEGMIYGSMYSDWKRRKGYDEELG